jgi:hypothetical protein
MSCATWLSRLALVGGGLLSTGVGAGLLAGAGAGVLVGVGAGVVVGVGDGLLAGAGAGVVWGAGAGLLTGAGAANTGRVRGERSQATTNTDNNTNDALFQAMSFLLQTQTHKLNRLLFSGRIVVKLPASIFGIRASRLSINDNNRPKVIFTAPPC